MSKKRKVELTSATRRPQLRSEDDEIHIDWSKCFICQNKTKEQLQCSYNAKLPDCDKIRANYSELAERMLQFKTEGVMPFNIDFNALSGSDDLGQSLYCNQASHHKSCKLLFSSSKLAFSPGTEEIL